MVYAAETFKYIFDYRPGKDVHFCTADLGWVTGHSYILYGPLANGAHSVMFEGVPTFPNHERFWQVRGPWRVPGSGSESGRMGLPRSVFSSVSSMSFALPTCPHISRVLSLSVPLHSLPCVFLLARLRVGAYRCIRPRESFVGGVDWGFVARRVAQIVDKHKVTTFYTAPTALRSLMVFGEEPVKKYDLSSLRLLGSVGEAINPEVRSVRLESMVARCGAPPGSGVVEEEATE